jgi:hypothetical protein
MIFMEIIPLQESYNPQTLRIYNFPKLFFRIQLRRKPMKLLTVLMLCALAIGCGYGSHAMATPGTMPTIASFNPPSATAGGAAFSLQVMGANFGSGAFVTFNNAQMATTWNSAGQVTAQIPQAAIATAQTVPVTVTNPATGGIYGTRAATSTAMMFTINP